MIVLLRQSDSYCSNRQTMAIHEYLSLSSSIVNVRQVHDKKKEYERIRGTIIRFPFFSLVVRYIREKERKSSQKQIDKNGRRKNKKAMRNGRKVKQLNSLTYSPPLVIIYAPPPLLIPHL